MELIDNDDIEMIRWKGRKVGGVQALDRREHVLEMCRLRSADPLLAE